jgi:3,4-dihydroxy 2-butanone 4-phosphate synthase/GTP cyclohydrolase II
MNDLVVPGHIFPLRACSGGVLKRAGHTEGSVDLARLAGLKPAAVICEVMNEDGSMARMPELEHFAREHGLFIIAIDDLIAYRREEQLLGGQKQASMAHKVTLNSSSEAEQSSTL